MDLKAPVIHNTTDPSGWTSGDLDYFVVKEKEYTETEHATWKALYQRQMKILPGRAISQFTDSLATLGISQDRIPSFDEVNAILKERTGWQAVPVQGFVPEEPFFELLANRRFPCGNFIRKPDQMDYIEEPDVFHDMFGHIPILADPTFADYIESYGHGALKAAKLGALDKINRLYWYTVEFGLMEEEDGLRIYGAGILSSPTETVFSLDSDSPNRIRLDINRVMRTHYNIDDFQDTYFAVPSFEKLFEMTAPDFTPLYKEIENLPIIQPDEIIETDDVITRGTNTYAKEAAIRRKARRDQGKA